MVETMETTNNKSWVLEEESGRVLIVDDLIGWCDTNQLNTYLLYRTYDKSDMNNVMGKRYYNGYYLKGRASNL